MRPAPVLTLLGLALAGALPGAPAAAQGIRNAPPPRALETAAYIFAAANVCGYQIGVAPFEALLGRYQVSIEDVRPPRGPFGAKVQTIFTLMSNQMMQNRDAACLAVAGEYGPEGSVVKGILLPGAGPDGTPPRAAP
ncbi:hypothetical protein OPKNFCMD_1886 [Methylobacterium crusticola]|uniref:Uncharacterized protein n=1 Tax=Methylobacterium crusticola TaxID=1697972 RepID=A0ABQ4QUZ7_9HYPH|nr:hypothetical protein [Methylobacterium crusticola]GJD49156.1 hypothetical protein OPKNFCMD_1886 [Methylobacterium crusticola]